MSTVMRLIIGAFIAALILLALVSFAPAGSEERVVSAWKVQATIDSLRDMVKEGCKREPIVAARGVRAGNSAIQVIVTCPDAEGKGKNDQPEKRKEP